MTHTRSRQGLFLSQSKKHSQEFVVLLLLTLWSRVWRVARHHHVPSLFFQQRSQKKKHFHIHALVSKDTSSDFTRNPLQGGF